MEIAITALWITLISYIVFVTGRWIYVKFIKSSPDSFFYFISLKIDGEKAWYLRIEAPEDDFDLAIDLSLNGEVIWTKNACLKAGINSIYLFNEEDQKSTDCSIQIRSSSQSIDRKFVEAED